MDERRITLRRLMHLCDAIAIHLEFIEEESRKAGYPPPQIRRRLENYQDRIQQDYARLLRPHVAN